MCILKDIPIDSIICYDVVKPFPLDDGSIDVVITSPPYWGLRDYGVRSVFGGDPKCKHIWGGKIPPRGSKSGKHGPNSTIGAKKGQDDARRGKGSGFCKICGAWKGQLGLEPHPQMFIDHLVMIFGEVKRVLKKSGSFYLNLGDTYYASGGAGGDYNEGGLREGQPKYKQEKTQRSNWLQPKQLLGIPERVMIALQDDGWILRNKNVWHKLNSMPSSVKDRLNNTWEPVFHFVKSRKYYYDLDNIREPHKDSSLDRAKYDFNMIPRAWEQEVIPVSGGKKVNIDCHPVGKNPGDIIQYNGKFKDASKHYQSVSERKNYECQVLGVPHDLATSHPAGKNPGDIIEFDEKYWWNFILGRAHSNRFYKKAYELMKNWMIENNCFDYGIFYEWYRKEFEGKWASGTLKKGKATYLSDEKRLPFPKPETRFLGDIPSDFWDITTQPFTGYNPELEHFAVFPEELVLKPLLASCPKEICKKCGKPRTRLIKTDNPSKSEFSRDKLVKANEIQKTSNPQSIKSLHRNISPDGKTKGVYYSGETVGWSDCGCGEGFDAGVVLDPFAGRGTVGKVAKQLGLHYILFDIKPEYCELARLYIGGQKYKLHKDQSKLGIK